MAIRPIPANRTHHPVMLRMPAALVARIDEYARSAGIRTRSAAALELIEAGLPRETPQTAADRIYA